MIKTLILWSILLINIFMFPASGSTSTSTMEDSQKEAQSMYGMIMESNKPSSQRTYQQLHVIQHTMTAQKVKTVYGGVNNVRGSHKRKSGASSYSVKSSSLFIAAIKYLIPGLLLVCYIF